MDQVDDVAGRPGPRRLGRNLYGVGVGQMITVDAAESSGSTSRPSRTGIRTSSSTTSTPSIRRR